MPRTGRIAFDQGFYHVYNRGINKENIFLADADYHLFLKRLEDLSTKLGYDHSVYAYVLMPNHFHLLIGTRKIPLAKIMTSLLTSYSMRFNNKHGRVGVVFQNRFKSKLCNTDSYFWGGSRYIILNPIHAGLETNLEQYPWSSYQEMYPNGRSTYNIVDHKELTRLIGDTPDSKMGFRKFLVDGIKLGNLESEYGFDREVEGPAAFATMAQRKYIRRKKLFNI